MFVIGAVMAKHRLWFSEAIGQLSGRVRGAITAGAVLCYTYPFWLAPYATRCHSVQTDDLIVTAGASWFVMIALSQGSPGRCSIVRRCYFSDGFPIACIFYHAVVLLSLVNAFFGHVPLWIILCCSSVVSIFISWLAYGLVEAPSTRLGRALGKWLNQDTDRTSLDHLARNRAHALLAEPDSSRDTGGIL